MKTITYTLINLALMLSPLYLEGSHIIGGTAAYQIINITDEIATVQVEFYLYTDLPSPDQIDENIKIGIYGYTGEEYEYISKKTAMLTNESPIDFENIEDCPLNMFPYTLGIYSFQIQIPTVGYDHYTFAYLRCCRDYSITNIVEPAESGIAITLDIFPKAYEFQDQIQPLKSSYPVQVEPGNSSYFDISIEDDFDKEYYLSTPKASNGNFGPGHFGCNETIPEPATCLPDYPDVSYRYIDHPYGPEADIELDKESGILNVNFPMTSKVLVGITLDRYADDELVCRARQQFIINSVNCSPLSINNFKGAKIDIWPVPTKENIQFSIPLKNVSVYNFTGDLQSMRHGNQFINKVDVSHLPEGIYFLKGLSKKGEWVIKKIIK